MKKAILNLPAKRMSYLPKITSRRVFGTAGDKANFATAAYKEDGEEDDEDEEREKLLKAIEKRVSKMVTTRSKEEAGAVATELRVLLGGKAEDTKMPDFPIEAIRALADEKTGALAALAKQGEEINKLKADIKKGVDSFDIRSQVSSWMEKNKQQLDSIRNGMQVLPPKLEIQLRAADSPMTPATVMPGGTTHVTRFEVQREPVEQLRREPSFWDFIRKGSTGSETYFWVNKKATDGAAGWIGPGVYKPAISFTVNTESSKAKKIAVNAKMAIELLDDIDGFTSWVTDELQYMLFDKINETLGGTGVATSTLPAGILSMSEAFNALTGVKTKNPTFWDCVIACVTQLRLMYFKGPIVCRCNPVDIVNAKITKAEQQGQLFIPPATGVTAYLEDVTMPKGYINVYAVDPYNVKIYKGFSMDWGMEMDDFTKNLRTVIAEMRLHNYVSENHDGFSIYDTLVNIKAGIIEE